MQNQFKAEPYLSSGSNQYLSLESTLQELPLYKFKIDISCLGLELAQIFEKYPLLPGAILIEKEQFCGMISRRQLLEYLLHPQGLELFLNQPLEILYSYARRSILVFSGDTPILTAAQQALRRVSEMLGEPIVVQVEPSVYQLLDFQQLNLAAWQLRGIETQVRYERTQAEMIQSEKMSSLGRLVDGLAHEILDPLGFIWGNLTYVSSYSKSLIELLSAYEVYLPEKPVELEELSEEVELEFLREDLPRTLESIKVGAERLKKLSVSLQNFCHVDEIYPKPADLNASIDGIVLLLQSRLKSEIEIVKNYGYLPPVNCYIGQLNQVFMNILTNAVDVLLNQAISQKLAQELNQTTILDAGKKPRIEINTEVISRQSELEQKEAFDVRWISVRIIDNGPGMTKEIQEQILESFSIKQRAAKETSLAVSYQTISAKHGGELKLRSQLGVGTEFEILLPLV